MNVHKRIRTRIKKIQKNRKNNTLSRHIHQATLWFALTMLGIIAILRTFKMIGPKD